MNKYEKGELVTTTGSNDKKISWIATGDEQKDAAIEIQILEATKCLDWSYGRTNIENQTVDCSGLTAYLYELVGTEIPHTSRSRGEGSPGQYNSSNGTQIFNYNVNDADSIDWDSVPTGSILTFGDKGGHVAYYLGNGYILHALSTDEDVVISSVYDRTSDDSINQSDNGKYYTSTGMEIVSKKAYHSWDQQQKPLCYITTFEDSIYVDKNGNVIRPEMLDGNKLTPNGVIYGDTDIIIYADDNGISYIKENGEFIPISESVDAGASLNGIGDEIDSDNEFISHFKIIKSNVATAQTARVINYDPIILDLDGDGFNIESKENGSHFDLDNNGFAEKINWTSKDGFLCLDLNGNGAVDNGGELFGDNTLLADGTKAKNGFEALAQYDSNGDGVIDKNDEIFESLRIWVDADGSGTSSEGEMKTLSELGISGIKLNYTVLNGETGTEAVLGNMATFIREDGTEGSAAELWVSSDLFDTTETLNVEISEEIAKLPDVRSIGNAHSLRTAMALDETGTLKGYVEEFVNSNNAAEKRQAVEKILYFICGAENIDSASRGGNMDARQLAVLETMLGENFTGVNGADPNTVAAPILKEAYNNLFNLYFTELIKETVLKEYLPLIRYSEDENGDKVINTKLFDLVMDYTARQNEETASHIIGAASLYIDSLKASGYTYTGNFVEDYMKKSSTIAIGILGYTGMGLVADGENPLNGTSAGEYLGGSANGDEINAENGDDIIIGGKGDDVLNGGKGCDTYVFNIGDGNDVVYDSHTYYYDARNDRIKFGEGITADSVNVRREDNNLIFEYGNGDMVTVKDHFASEYNSIEYVDFEDGTTWDLAKLTDISRVIKGTDGADELNGFTDGAYYNISEIFYGGDGDDVINAYNGNDTIYAGEGNDTVNAGDGDDIIFGGKGDDVLNGGKGCDTYVFNIGDGNDVVYDSHTYYYDARNDRIKFGEGITADSVNVRREDNNLIFEYGNGDMVTVKDHFASEYNSIEYVEFEDGTIWNLSKLTDLSRMVRGTDGADELNGFTDGAYYNTSEIFYAGNGDDIINAYNGNDTIYAGEGNDTVNAGDGDDIIFGGKGDDVLNGGKGCDTYVFNIGDGNDVVYDSHTYYYDARNDRIKFGEGITADSVNVRREDNNLIFEYGNGDMVTVKDHFASEYNSIEYVEFEDGTIWNLSKLTDLSRMVRGTDGADELNGFTDGAYYNTSEIFYAGNGDDIINAYNGNDTIYAGEGNDTVNAGDGDDIIFGGKGDDVLNGGTGCDTYVFNIGDGNDVVYDSHTYYYDARNDRIKFGEGITADSVNVRREDNNLIFEYGNGDMVTVKDHFASEYNSIEYVDFEDGTTWDLAKLTDISRVIKGTDGADELNGFTDGAYYNISEIFYGGDGDDVINAYNGNDTIYAGEGNDTVNAGDGDDIIFGGKGDDVLNGGKGCDTYVFNIGDGNDVVYDSHTYYYDARNDRIKFGEGITADSVNVRREDNNLIFEYGNGDMVTVKDHFASEYNSIEYVEFEDGTIWNLSKLTDLSRMVRGTDGADELNGFTDGAYYNTSEIFYAGNGDDIINAYNGNDTIYAGEGNDTVNAGDGDDIIFGGKGDDVLNGGKGCDTYVFNIGDGNDVVYDSHTYYYDARNDRIKFGEGITADSVNVRREDNNLIFEYGNGDMVTVKDHFASEYNSIEYVEFEDGTIWNLSKLTDLSRMVRGTDGADELNGFTDGAYYNTSEIFYAGNGDDIINAYNGNDTIYAGEGNDTVNAGDGDDIIFGGKGDDVLNGGKGCDTYVFNIGDGNDVVYDSHTYYYDARNDRIKFGEGITADSVNVRREDNNLIFEYGNGDMVTVKDHFASEYNSIEYVDFEDGTTWDLAKLTDISRVIKGTDGADELNGFTGGAYYNTSEIFYAGNGDDIINAYNGNDTIYAGEGNDTVNAGDGDDIIYGGKGDDILNGGTGCDTYVFNIGDGNDIVYDSHTYYYDARNDRIKFGEGITADSVNVRREDNNLIFEYGNGDMVTVKDHFASEYNSIEYVEFSNGDIITNNQIDKLIQAMASFEADSGMTWNEAIENNDKRASDIITEMWIKTA